MTGVSEDTSRAHGAGGQASRVLAVDIGGTGLRVAILDADGTCLAAAHEPGSAIPSDGERSEIDPQRWWDAFLAGCARLSESAGEDLAAVAGIVVCGATRTQVFLGEGGEVLGPAIAFRDARAGAEAEDARRIATERRHPHARHVNAFHPLARLLWVGRHEPGRWRRTRAVIEPKDYLNLRLTGIVASDPISQFWLNAAHEGDSPLAGAVGVDRKVLPPLLSPMDRVGVVRPGLAGVPEQLSGVPVFCGCNDTWVAVVGLGGLVAGRAYNISGTSEVFGLMAEKPGEADGLITIGWGEGLWQIGGPGQNGADLVRWAVDRFAADREGGFDSRLASILAAPPAARPLVFLPYLHGERTPYWNRDLTASFLGLRAEHGPADFVRAVMEGIAFSNRVVLERAEAAAGGPAGEVRFAGGGARIAGWAQMKADILDRTVTVPAADEPGLRGCAAVARVGLGLSPTIAAAQEAVAGEVTRFTADRRRAAGYTALYRIFRRAHDAVAPLSADLAGLPDRSGQGG